MNTDGKLAIAKLIAVLKKVVGRKRLQKIVHLLGARGHSEFRYRFILHHYGPFSRDAAFDLDFVSCANLVDEQPREKAYIYSVDEKQAARISDFRGDGEQVPEWAGLAEKLNDQETVFLEALSTYVFLYTAGNRGSKLRATFGRIKSHLTAHFDDVARFAEEESLLADRRE